LTLVRQPTPLASLVEQAIGLLPQADAESAMLRLIFRRWTLTRAGSVLTLTHTVI
jgi:hypothetical protein